MRNQALVLKDRPLNVPTDDNFSIVEEPYPAIKPGHLLIRTLYLSVDPYMRERMGLIKSYIEPFEIGEVIEGVAIGMVVESKNEDFNVGDFVQGFMKWQEFNLSDGTQLTRVPDTSGDYLQLALGPLGSPGITAYVGLCDVGQPKSGETVVVSAAGSAVGTVVCQLAKQFGCRIVGISGSDDKNEYLRTELGVDATINYKTVDDMEAALIDACPDGIDIYFDNVGDEILNLVASLINKNGRVLLCGQISQYNGHTPYLDPGILGKLTKKSAEMKGFLIRHFSREQVQRAREQLTFLVNEGKIKNTQTIVNGLENAPSAIIGLFSGNNTGKMMVKLT